jgi:hypothetical protein
MAPVPILGQESRAVSDIPADYPTRLNLAELVARIERQQEETRKFVSEQHKLQAEAEKLASTARKFDRERGLAPWQATAITIGSVAALLASIVSLAKSMGWF